MGGGNFTCWREIFLPCVRLNMSFFFNIFFFVLKIPKNIISTTLIGFTPTKKKKKVNTHNSEKGKKY